MKIIHRIRMWHFNFSANRLMKRVQRAHENRPHVQSEFMIGRPAPKALSDFEKTARYVLLLFVVAIVVGCINSTIDNAKNHRCAQQTTTIKTA